MVEGHVNRRLEAGKSKKGPYKSSGEKIIDECLTAGMIFEDELRRCCCDEKNLSPSTLSNRLKQDVEKWGTLIKMEVKDKGKAYVKWHDRLKDYIAESQGLLFKRW